MVQIIVKDIQIVRDVHGLYYNNHKSQGRPEKYFLILNIVETGMCVTEGE